MLTNPRDAFRGHSRSPNIAPFHSFLLVCNSNFAIFPIFDFKNVVTLISGSGHSRSSKAVPFDRLGMVSYSISVL